MPEFQIGDRVKISESWFVPDIAGRIGVVSQHPESATLHEGCYWIELEVGEWKPGVVEAGEVDGRELQGI